MQAAVATRAVGGGLSSSHIDGTKRTEKPFRFLARHATRTAPPPSGPSLRPCLLPLLFRGNKALPSPRRTRVACVTNRLEIPSKSSFAQ